MLASTVLIKKLNLSAPIVCEECGGDALLRRRTIDTFKQDGSEIWTFECIDCRYHMQQLRQP
jgi:hypothetical protein